MRLTLLGIVLFLCAGQLLGQHVKFKKNDDYVKVVRRDVVEIDTDTAYVMDVARADFINSKLDDLNHLSALCDSLKTDKKALVNELSKTQKVLGKLAIHMNGDNDNFNNNLETLIVDLEATLKSLKANNQSLDENNNELLGRISNLERIIKDLKKETRGIWWNGVADKFVVFGGGLAVGVLLASLL